VSADFNDDGWPELYLGINLHPNRLLLNDSQGRALASGVYLYRLEAGARMETRKLVLLQ
jgi:hypothetical protein